MDNHIHLLYESGEIHISKVMHSLLSDFCKKYNKKHNKKGHLFEGRFKSYLVDKENYLLVLIRYILNNPVRAGMVNNAWDYLWNSYSAYFSKKKSLITDRFIKNYFVNENEFKKFLKQDINENINKKVIKNVSLIGKEDFIKKIINKFHLNERKERRIKTQIQEKEIVNCVLSFFEANNLKQVNKHPTKRNCKIRRIISYFLKKYSHMSLKEIGNIVNSAKSNVSKMIINAGAKDLKEIKTIKQNILNLNNTLGK
jgi:hypothetical protein